MLWPFLAVLDIWMLIHKIKYISWNPTKQCCCPIVEYPITLMYSQQYSKQLEETMERFAQGKIKILICTNIVESGLDIQNANTIIIQDVQQFGLAQLYQVPSYLFTLFLRHYYCS